MYVSATESMFYLTCRAYRRLFGKTKADLVTQLDGMYRTALNFCLLFSFLPT